MERQMACLYLQSRTHILINAELIHVSKYAELSLCACLLVDGRRPTLLLLVIYG